MVLKVLKEHQLFSKYSNCQFWLTLAFVVHIISSEGVEVDPMEKEDMKNWPRPLTPTDVRSFLALVEYHRPFVDGFASIESPLTTLIQKSVKFEWS